MTASRYSRIRRASGPMVALLLWPVASLAAAQDTPDTRPPQRRLTVQGQAEIKVKPDKADVVIGVVTENRASQAAARANAEASQSVQSALKRLNIPDKDIQTVNYSITPVYEQGNVRRPMITGYRVYNQVRVTIRQIEKISDVIDAASAAGSNTIEGVSFGIQDDKAVTDEALEQAIQDARRKANRLAKAAGVEIQGVYEIMEGGLARPMPFMAMKAGFGGAAAEAATPIAPGELTVSANVTVVYQISKGM